MSGGVNLWFLNTFCIIHIISAHHLLLILLTPSKQHHQIKKISIPYYVVIVDSTFVESTIASFKISFFNTSTFFGTVGLLH